MNKIKMKARAGVTLVELLVVILIVTILSVSLLPLLKPYIEKSKYAAEPIPVLANLQTKIELYQYEKGIMPCASNGTTANDYYSWYFDISRKAFLPMKGTASTTLVGSGHLQDLTDTDWQDLTGKNMRPSDFQYVVTKNEKGGSYCYAVGVFGGHDDSGLLSGTGYAVCKIVDLGSSNKLVATWERYKPVGNAPLAFSVQVAGDKKNDVFVPSAGALAGNISAWQTVTNSLKLSGWQF